MKKVVKINYCALLVVLALYLLPTATQTVHAQRQPLPPDCPSRAYPLYNQFYGQIYINDSPIVADALIKVLSSSNQVVGCGLSDTAQNMYPAVKVFGNSINPPFSGLNDGDAAIFTVNGNKAVVTEPSSVIYDSAQTTAAPVCLYAYTRPPVIGLGPTRPPCLPLTPSPAIYPSPTVTAAPTGANCTHKSRGDANCDGVIDIVDANIFNTAFLTAKADTLYYDSPVDFNNDQHLDHSDFDIWFESFRQNFN